MVNANEQHSAAHCLEGKTLKTGWKVLERVKAKPGSSGSHFSVCYLVEKDGQQGFLKALNILKFLNEDDDVDLTKAMADALETFNFEKELLLRCRNKNLSKVSKLLEAERENFKGYLIANVFYLIFEKADGDVRAHINFAEGVDTAWKLRSLHNIATGLKQLHGIEIGHQDLKPSNVFVFEKTVSKLGDLGRSLCKTLDGPHSKSVFPGDIRYCPPEIMLGYRIGDWDARVYAIDLYLLGSMAVYYFTGLNMTSLLVQHIDKSIDWNAYHGKFKQAVQYLESAFDESLEELKKHLGDYTEKDELIEQIRMLCHPDPDFRGHPKNIEGLGSNYDLERFVTKFNVLATKAEYRLTH
jgi:serine/threonine protein kinase